MKEYNCYYCAHAIYDREHEVDCGNNREPVFIDYVLCNCKALKDILSAKMDTRGGVPIGRACWTCEGNHYIATEESILSKMD